MLLPATWRAIRRGMSNFEELKAFYDDLTISHQDHIDDLNRELEGIAERKKAMTAKIAELTTDASVETDVERRKVITTEINELSVRMMIMELTLKGHYETNIKRSSARWNEVVAAFAESKIS
jgi:hypothetical protein